MKKNKKNQTVLYFLRNIYIEGEENLSTLQKNTGEKL